MSKDNLEYLFKNLEGQFDVETPNNGHEARFLEKLNALENTKTIVQKDSKSYWKPLLAVAASIALIISISFAVQAKEQPKDLASVSPEMAETQQFFTNAIAFEVNKLKAEQTQETKTIINDALKRLNELEKEYDNLKISLQESGEDQLVIYAMITNFQNRIDILKTTLQYIEDQKELKQNNYETTI